MRLATRWAVLFTFLALGACGHGSGEPSPDATPTVNPDDYFAHRGQITPLRTALGEIAFRPFIPAREIVETALLPPYNGGDDVRQNRGIGFEYVQAHQSFVLSQWPGAGKNGPYQLGTERGCQLSAYDIAGGTTGHRGVLWSNGSIASNLVAAGNASDKAVYAEARRLVRLGACR
ncbi:MAG: hypothetical protein JO359_14275 [Candidatus Eremiobacteraeota bacterium]|nr:hypothetical protein [Candidatus Eremiobacteraeota bacterium]